MRIRFVRCMVVAFAAAIFSSCANKPREYYENLKVINVDSCEYLYIHNAQGVALVHKENCKNHKNQKHCVFCHSNIE